MDVNATKTRRERVADKEAAIIKAARELFIQGGVAKTTIAGIAKQAGMADGTVYLYFKNKEAVAHAVLSDFYADLTQKAQATVDALSDPRNQMEGFARLHLKEVVANWQIFEAAPKFAPDYDETTFYRLNKTYVAVFRQVAKAAQGQGLIRPDLPLPVLRDIFFGALEHAVRTQIIRREKEVDDAFIAHLIDLIFVTSSDTKSDPGTPVMDRLDEAVTRLEILLKE